MEGIIDIPVKRKVATIRVYDTGEITLSSRLVKRMKLKEGDHIKLSWGDTQYKELYLSKCDSGVELRKKDSSCLLRCYSIDYANILLLGKRKGIFRIGEIIEDKYFTIIYKKNYAEAD